MTSKKIFLRGGDNLFFNDAVLLFFMKLMSEWQSSKKIALLMGCSAHKPYSKSFIHRKVISMLRRHNLSEYVQEYVIGEPMTVVPREWENVYPADSYDFPPEKLGDEGRRIFINRLNAFFRKAIAMHETFIVFAPNHHKKIILEACNNLFEPIVVPYNIYNLPKLLNALKEVVK